ncbi:MAG: sulfatase [Armatimonadota bacterium]
MNILLIAIDTLRADHLGCYGYHRSTSPNLDELAAQGALFKQLLCGCVPTQPSYTSLYTGQYSVTHGIVTHGGTKWPADGSPFFTHDLQPAGYTTCAVDNLYGMQKWFAAGYEFYINPTGRVHHFQTVDCQVYNSRAIPWLRAHANEQFFMFVHYWDPHTPYLPPERLRGLYYDGNPCDPQHSTMDRLYEQPFGDWWSESWFKRLQDDRITDAEYIVAMYDSEINYVDEAVGELLNALDETGHTDDTLVIVFSDHGELMYRHDIYFDHHGLYRGNLHVPLIMRWPERIPAGTVVEPLVQHIDIAPTILEAAGAEVPQGMEGHSLLAHATGRTDERLYDYLITQECTWQAKWAIRTDDHNFIKARVPDAGERQPDLHGMPPQELYDLRADPDELSNIAEERPNVAAQLEQKLEAWIAEMMAKNGLAQDPLVAQGITLGKRWHEWVQEKGYW